MKVGDLVKLKPSHLPYFPRKHNEFGIVVDVNPYRALVLMKGKIINRMLNDLDVVNEKR